MIALALLLPLVALVLAVAYLRHAIKRWRRINATIRAHEERHERRDDDFLDALSLAIATHRSAQNEGAS